MAGAKGNGDLPICRFAEMPVPRAECLRPGRAFFQWLENGGIFPMVGKSGAGAENGLFNGGGRWENGGN